MIRRWLLKHRWVNELGKTMAATFFGAFCFAVWEAGKLASADIYIPESYKLMYFGIIIGLIGSVALTIFVDVVFSVIGIVRRKNSYEEG